MDYASVAAKIEMILRRVRSISTDRTAYARSPSLAQEQDNVGYFRVQERRKSRMFIKFIDMHNIATFEQHHRQASWLWISFN